MEYILNEKPEKISIKQWLKIGIFLALIVISAIIFMVTMSIKINKENVAVKVKEEFYKEESIIEQYDEILKFSMERDYKVETDEHLPKDVNYALFHITVLAIVNGDECVEHRYIACVFYQMYRQGGIIKSANILDCDFARVNKGVE